MKGGKIDIMITSQEIEKLDKELKADGKPSLKDIENILNRQVKSGEYCVYLNKHLGYSSISDTVMPIIKVLNPDGNK